MPGSATEAQRVAAVTADGLTPGDSTPGLTREVAFSTGRAILIRTRCDGHATSGWHHHGNREVLGHVLHGRVRFEYGPGGGEHTEVEEHGYFRVPVGLVHRDVNPGDEPQELVIAFVGDGPLVVNVDGP
jgi:uncharacterized RmlC-like cupin family protein